jgi:pimeloyl-ACP methyl ester carboxylesterase
VLLHPGGAGVDARAWGSNLPALAEQFRVFTPERRAHGRTPDVDGPITFELMADDTIALLDAVVGEPAHLVGCSDGAIVALLVAVRRPDLIRKLVFVGGVFHRDGWAPGVGGLLVEKPTLCNTVIIDFLTTDPVPTMAPIRRA